MLNPRVLLVWLGIGAGIGCGAVIGSPTVATSGPVLVLIGRAEFRRRQRALDARVAAERLPDVVDHLIQQLRSGRSLVESCRRLEELELGAPVAALVPMWSKLRAGGSLLEATTDLLAADDPPTRLLAVTLRVLARSGGPAIPALQRLRHTLIGVVHGQQRAAAESSQALASAALLVLAPGVFAAVLASVDSSAAELYLFEPLGAICVAVAIGLSWLGWCWIHRLLVSAGRSAS